MLAVHNYALPPKRKDKLVRVRSRQNKAAVPEQQLVALNEAQADDVLLHSERLKALDQAKLACASLGDATGASLVIAVDNVIKWELKRFRERTRVNPEVANAMRKTLAAEEADYARKRQAFQEHMRAVRDKKRAQEELKIVQQNLKKAKKDAREALELRQAKEFTKSFSLDALGLGKKNAGGLQYQKARGEVLERLRRASPLSATQTADWNHFKTEWDKTMAELHGKEWAKVFAEEMQQVVDDLDRGDRNALSQFVYRETLRVLQPLPVLQIRGTSVQTQP